MKNPRYIVTNELNRQTNVCYNVKGKICTELNPDTRLCGFTGEEASVEMPCRTGEFDGSCYVINGLDGKCSEAVQERIERIKALSIGGKK